MLIVHSHNGVPTRLTEERWQLAEELAGRSRAGVTVKTLATALWLVGVTFLESGQRARSDAIGKELKDLAERTRQANAILLAMWQDTSEAVMDGRLVDRRIVAEGRWANGVPIDGHWTRTP